MARGKRSTQHPGSMAGAAPEITVDLSESVQGRTCRHCYENGNSNPPRHCHERKAYDAGVAFTKKIRRLLAANGVIPIPAASDHSDPRPGMTPPARKFAELLEQDGRDYRLYMKACARAAVVLASLDVTDASPAPAALAEAA